MVRAHPTVPIKSITCAHQPRLDSLQSYQLATTIANFLMLASLDANRYREKHSNGIAEAGTKRKRESARHAPDADPGARAPGAERCTASRKQRKKERFTALLHRVNVDTPWAAFYALKRKAAAGVARGGLATRSAASSNPISCVNALTTAAKTGGQTPLPSNLMRSRLDPYGRV